MTDRRITPANERVAHVSLRGSVEADEFTEGHRALVTRPVADLRSSPGGARDRQLLFGDAVTVLESRGGWSFVQSERDGYVGYVADAMLASSGPEPTHFVGTPATHAYRDADIKSPDLLRVPFGARLSVTAELKRFWETPQGYVPKSHLRPLDRPFSDPVTVAQMHFGTPYLWGGNSTLGIDCSGLVQAGWLACGLPCPGDSDLQSAAVGASFEDDPRRGDLFFWAGHVGVMVDGETMIHANAHHMAVAYEPLETAILRIRAQGDGEVTARRRM